VANLRQRLADEPVPKQSATVPTAVAVSKNSAPLRVEAANEPVFRWKMIAGVASIAAAAAIGWNWIGAGASAPAGPQLAQQQQQQAPAGSLLAAAPPSGTIAPTQVVVGNGSTNAPQIMLRDARLDQMLQAHQQAGGSSQMPSGFLRNATFESPSR
jgi:sigma-E factor negative regulatory protein RseA